MKRKSDCLEDKQIKMVKKLKEDKSEDVEPMEVEESSSPVKKKKKVSPKVSKKKASANYKSRDESYKNFFSKFQGMKCVLFFCDDLSILGFLYSLTIVKWSLRNDF